jgi:hypothetical protein
MSLHDPFAYLKYKLWASKIVKISILKISKLSLDNFKTKWHLGASPVI